ncbi:MAG: D-glycero-beta-D-manno-heptose-7-phosphate kinase [Acidobacteriota bacterium]|nr:D-glycero-beta-D-manno-heptose-7-phosphate kinase [Acidobacteriota bacterium]
MFNRYKCDPEDLIRSIRNFRGKRILVVGDLMLDRFIWGSVSRISPEAPVPVVEIRKESTCLGGAANVATNIRSLGGTPVPLGILGDDFEGKRLREEFRRLGSPLGGLIVEKGRPTSIKTRIIAHHQQVCRTDREDRSPIPASLQSRIADRFRAALPSVDAVVVSDYAKGLITAPLLRQILPLAKAARKIVCIDPKLRDFSVYRPATIITPNAAEAEHASGIAISGTQDLIRAGKKILRQSGIEHLLITRGEEGMALFESNSRVTHIPTVAQEVFDVTGAGDTVISTLALSLVSGLSMLAAAVLSNIAAGIVVGKLGTASATPDELTAAIRNL